MEIVPIPKTEPRPSERALVHLSYKDSTSTERLYLDPSGRIIPVHVVARHVEHAKLHSQDEWDAIKPTIQRLYLDEDRSLKQLMRIMARDHDFHATISMYKIRFRRWGWRKNQPQTQRHTMVLSGPRTKGVSAFKLQIRHVGTPDLLNDQEVPILISKGYTIDPSGCERWNCIVLNMSEPTPSAGQQQQHGSMVRFCDAETAYVSTIHQLRSGRIHDAFQSLNRLFDNMTGSRLYLHPKYLTGFWLLCHGIYNACAWINDSGFHLLRELLCFHGQNAAACFPKAASHPIVSLMRSVARMSRDNPSVMKQTFRNAYRAAAESLEAKLGESHPVVLVTWTDYFWYFNFPVDPAMDLVARQETALVEAEAASGRDADLTICLLHNLTFFLFYCIADDGQAREKLADLLERAGRRIAAQPSPTSTPTSFHVQRAHAFGSLLRGLFILRDYGDLGHCQEVIGAAIEWLRHYAGSDGLMHAQMLEMDLFMLTNAWKQGNDLRELTLAFAKPRSADYDGRKPQRERQLSEETASLSSRSE